MNKEFLLLSDHMPFLVAANSYLLFSWNILHQMKYYKDRRIFNNGFGCANESAQEYLNRLSHIAFQMTHAVKEENIAFICLQECPKTDIERAYFIGYINTHLMNYAIVLSDNNSEEYMMTLYDTQRFKYDDDLTHTVSQAELAHGLAKRSMPIVFLDNNSKEFILVINIHANFRKNILNDVKAYYEIAKKLNIHQMILAGDFNRDLTEYSDHHSRHDIAGALTQGKLFECLYAYNAPLSSFMVDHKPENRETHIETRDGVIATMPLHVSVMPEMNRSVPVLLHDKPLSECLANFPRQLLVSGLE